MTEVQRGEIILFSLRCNQTNYKRVDEARNEGSAINLNNFELNLAGTVALVQRDLFYGFM